MYKNLHLIFNYTDSDREGTKSQTRKRKKFLKENGNKLLYITATWFFIQYVSVALTGGEEHNGDSLHGFSSGSATSRGTLVPSGVQGMIIY